MSVDLDSLKEKLCTTIKAKHKPTAFRITRGHILEHAIRATAPENKVNALIEYWISQIPEAAELRSHRPAQWQNYPAIFLHHVCIDNPAWPWTLPIGYVLCCWMMNRPTDTYRTKEHAREFTEWIMDPADYRVALFDAFYEHKYYITS